MCLLRGGVWLQGSLDADVELASACPSIMNCNFITTEGLLKDNQIGLDLILNRLLLVEHSTTFVSAK